jgi:hypothetical protein
MNQAGGGICLLLLVVLFPLPPAISWFDLLHSLASAEGFWGALEGVLAA